MTNLISIIAANIEVSPSPSRAYSRVAVRNRRAALKGALWLGLKAAATLSAVFVRELFL
ncbi:hypothetical protein [Paenibacillus durus]|uniref:hypothetical protein n=1 Tax=Paenibacillus durus TaxID=44251 RepID=UPI0012DFFB22|nr:hypothetical protein [Paenibacillus durus]